MAECFPETRRAPALVKLGGELAGDAVLPYVHFEELGVRHEARRLIGVLGVRPEAVLDQTLRDPEGGRARRRRAASGAAAEIRPEAASPRRVARPLEPRITDAAGEVNRKALPCSCAWRTPTASPRSSPTSWTGRTSSAARRSCCTWERARIRVPSWPSWGR